MENFPYDGQNDKVNLILVWMILIHVNGGLHSSLHWRREHNLPVHGIDNLVVRLTLFDTTCMEFRVDKIFTCFDSFKLRRTWSKVSFRYECFIIELGKTMSDQNIRAIFLLLLVHRWCLQRNVVLLNRFFNRKFHLLIFFL